MARIGRVMARNEFPPTETECWRVIEVYGTHKMINGVRQVVTEERWHGPFTTEEGAKRSVSQLTRNRASVARKGGVAAYFTIEKGLIQWQEN